MKTLREMMDLIEAAQRPHQSNTKNPVDFPRTWHDVDPKLGRAVDKMSQAEKVKKGFAHPDTLKKKGVAEGSGDISSMIQQYEDMVELVYDLPPGRKKNIAIDRRDALEAQIEAMPGGSEALRQWAKSYNDAMDEGVAEEQLEETTPEALAKIDELTRK